MIAGLNWAPNLNKTADSSDPPRRVSIINIATKTTKIVLVIALVL